MSGQNIEYISLGWRSLNWDMTQTRTLKFNGNLLNNNSGASEYSGLSLNKIFGFKIDVSRDATLHDVQSDQAGIFIPHRRWRLKPNWRHILSYLFTKYEQTIWNIKSIGIHRAYEIDATLGTNYVSLLFFCWKIILSQLKHYTIYFCLWQTNKLRYNIIVNEIVWRLCLNIQLLQ